MATRTHPILLRACNLRNQGTAMHRQAILTRYCRRTRVPIQQRDGRKPVQYTRYVQESWGRSRVRDLAVRRGALELLDAHLVEARLLVVIQGTLVDEVLTGRGACRMRRLSLNRREQGLGTSRGDGCAARRSQ